VRVELLMGCGTSKPLPAGEPPLKPLGTLKSVKVDDITGDGPFHIGKDPMPVNMRGLFWVQAQDDSSCIATMGGPTRDAGGCSPGKMPADAKYRIRVCGDRTWAFADKDVGTLKMVAELDLVYRFEWDSQTEPTFAHIFPELMAKGGVMPMPEWLMDFDIKLVPEGMAEYPGSVIWQRITKLLGSGALEPKEGESNAGTYKLVQIIGADGKRIEPAFAEFAKAMHDKKAGDEPGVIWYHEIDA